MTPAEMVKEAADMTADQALNAVVLICQRFGWPLFVLTQSDAEEVWRWMAEANDELEPEMPAWIYDRLRNTPEWIELLDDQYNEYVIEAVMNIIDRIREEGQ